MLIQTKGSVSSMISIGYPFQKGIFFGILFFLWHTLQILLMLEIYCLKREVKYTSIR